MNERYAVTYVTTATASPVSLEEFKLHAHIDGNDENESLETYINAATRAAQQRLDKQLCTATLRVTMDRFPCATRHNPEQAIYVPRAPLVSVTSIGYVGTEGSTFTMASTDYIVDNQSQPGRITPRYGDTWPDSREQINAVNVVYTAGYGGQYDVPDTIRQWIQVMAAYWYRNRESVNIGNIANELPFMDSLLGIEDYGQV